MGLVSMEDLEYYTQQSTGNINMIIAGMTELMNNNDEKIQQMESQNWFKRMVKTVLGKNKATKQEIQNNHEKLSAYMSEAIAELYNRGCIQEEMIMSLGMQINELYTDHLQLKSMLGAFACKLNDKIESVDNYHMLITEIEQGVYSSLPQLIAVCKILSMLDKRVIEDYRKLDILRRAIAQKGLISDVQVDLSDYLLEVVNVNQEDIGLIYMEIQNLKGNYLADIILDTIGSYFFLSDMNRKLADKKAIVNHIIEDRGLNGNVKMSTEDIYDDFINSKIDVNSGLIPIAEVQVEGKLKEAEELFLNCQSQEAYDIFNTLAQKGNGRAMYFISKYYTYGLRPVVKDEEKDSEWARKGAEEGDVLSTLISAWDYPEDSTERKTIYENVFVKVKNLSDRDDIFARYELALMYKDGYGTEEDFNKYWSLINEVADKGFFRAINMVGYAYYTNDKVGIDYGKALSYLKKASDMGYGLASYWLADMYYNGNGVNKDYGKAFEIYEKGVEQGNGNCANSCGLMYYNGEGVEKDSFKEVQMYMKGAELGSAGAAYNLGLSYELGDGINESEEEALKWYRFGAERGSADCMYEVGWRLRKDKQYDEALRWLKESADLENKSALNVLGLMYEDGEGVEKDQVTAFNYYLQAAERGNKYGQRNVAICYKNGQGCDVDMEKAKEWIQKAADQGLENAIIDLKNWFDEGSGIVLTDDKFRVAGRFWALNRSDEAMEMVQTYCNGFIFMNNMQGRCENTYKLRNGLGINEFETVYLAHDDTVFGSGKNGFAITKRGIYCRTMMEQAVFTDYIDFVNADDIYVRNNTIYADSNPIAYFSGCECMDELKTLFMTIQMSLRS